MTIWIDADAAPRDVKEIVFRAAQRWLTPPRHDPHVRAVRVSGWPDAADRHIAAALRER